MKKFIQTIAIFALIAGVFFVTIGTHALVHIALSRSWDQVPGKILSLKQVHLETWKCEHHEDERSIPL